MTGLQMFDSTPTQKPSLAEIFAAGLFEEWQQEPDRSRRIFEMALRARSTVNDLEGAASRIAVTMIEPARKYLDIFRAARSAVVAQSMREAA